MSSIVSAMHILSILSYFIKCREGTHFDGARRKQSFDMSAREQR